MFAGAMPFAVSGYGDTVVVRFLSSYAILAAFVVAMYNSRFDSLAKFKDLSSHVDEIAHDVAARWEAMNLRSCCPRLTLKLQ